MLTRTKNIPKTFAAALVATALLFPTSVRAGDAQLEALKAKAEKGDVAAAKQLADRYAYGDWGGGGKNVDLAVKWYRTAADAGDVSAMKRLASIYSYTLKDETAAAEWNRKLALKGDVEAQYQLGYAYEFGYGVARDPDAAIEWFQKAADQGDERAMSELAKIYHPVIGSRPDKNKNFEWLHRLFELHHAKAEKGDDVARDALASDYYYGHGVPKDLAEALRWRRALAEEGKWLEQGYVAEMYENGEGVPANYAEAYYWYSIAGVNDATAREKAKKLEARMMPEQIAAAQKRASEFKPKKIGN